VSIEVSQVATIEKEPELSNRRTQKLNQYDLDLNDYFTRKCLKGKKFYPAQGKKCRVKILTLG
jgi:hypothetical protein